MSVIDDIEAVLGREMTGDELGRAYRLVEMAYAVIGSNLPGFAVGEGTAEDERIVHDDPDVAWTERYPVTAVTEVKIGDAVLSETSYRWTDRGRIELGQRCVLNEFEVNLAGWTFSEDLTVTYDYGLDVDALPDEVALVVAQMVGGVLRGQATNPDGVTAAPRAADDRRRLRPRPRRLRPPGAPSVNPSRLMTNTATITHVAANPASPDEYGNPGESTTTTTALCELQQKERDEEQTDSHVQGETWNLYLVPTATIDGGDRVEVDDVTYEVIGPPWRARHPRSGEITHIEATVRRAG